MSVDDGLRGLFRTHLPLLHWQSIETGGVGRGVPDSNYCGEGIEGWVEFKRTDGWTVDLRPEQIGWIARRVRAGGRVHVAVRRRHAGGPRRGPPVDELWLFSGAHVRQAKVGGLRGLPAGAAASWPGGPARWPWPAVWAAMAGRA